MARAAISETMDFTLVNGFNLIDTGRQGLLSMQMVLSFLKRHGYYLSSTELNRVWARFDRDGDGFLSYTEFVELVLPYASTDRLAVPQARMAPQTAYVSRASQEAGWSPSYGRTSPLRPESPIRSEASLYNAYRSF
jgi:hypothetical protein